MVIVKKYLVGGIITAAVIIASALTITFIVIEVNDNYTEHDPIVIWGDEDFYLYDFPGKGTSSNPFRIENYNITTEFETGIEVWNTTLYFVIEHCYISANETGIWIESIAPGTAIIENNDCFSNSRFGILLFDAPGQIINQNSVTNNKFGIYLQSSVGSAFLDNTVTNNDYGILLIDSSFSALSDCKITNNGIGIYIESSAEINIAESTFSNNDHGVYLVESDDTLLGDNMINNNDYGIYMVNSSGNSIGSNTITHNEYGLYLTSETKSSVFTYNLFDSNQIYAIYIESSCYGNIIHHNSFDNNSYGSIQAYDDGINVWYDTANNEGNWWYDWVSGSYFIDGIAGSVDPYPLEDRPV